MKNLLYHILNFTFPKFEKKILKILRKEKKLIIFDVGCYKGVFTKNNLMENKNTNFFFLMLIKM